MKSKLSVKGSVVLSLLTLATAVCLAQKPELVVQTGHSFWVNSIAFSPDGKTLASGSEDKTIRLWDVATGRELRALGDSNGITSVAFSPDGNILAGSNGYTSAQNPGAYFAITLWEAATGRKLRTLTGHSRSVISVAFSPDGKTLVSGSQDHTIRIWEVATGQELRKVTWDSEIVSTLAFSVDVQTVAIASSFGTKLLDLASGRELRTLPPSAADVWSAAFSRDGLTLVTGGATVKLWEVATGRKLREFDGHTSNIHSVALSANGKMLASGSYDGTIKLWDLATGRELRTLAGHSWSVTSLVFSADGTTLASGSWDQTIKLWDVAAGRDLRAFTGHSRSMYSATFSADGKTLAFGSDDKIKLWDVATGRELRVLTGHASLVTSLALSADGKVLASGSDNTIKLWQVATGRELRTLIYCTTCGFVGQYGGALWVQSVAFSPDGKTLASGILANGNYHDTIKLWDVATGRELHSLIAPSDSVYSLAFSVDGKTLASNGYVSTMKLWEVATGRELRTLAGHSNTIYSVAFSADGKTLAGGSGDHTIKLWEVATGAELGTLTGHSDLVAQVAFSPDGRILASGSGDHAIKLWEVATGRELRTLAGHSNVVRSLAFSADGTFLISASADATTKLWRVESGELLATLVALDQNDWAVVTPDGRFDASPNAQKLMHWMVGSEPIELEQLRERYYEPGLLAKLMGFSKEPLRDVSGFENPKLYPDIKYEPPAKGSSTLTLTLTNRGGGIGRVQVFVNDKEFLADARDDKLKQNPDVSQATLTIDLSTAPGRISGEENKLLVKAWNVDNYISSRGAENAWVAGGPTDKEPPEVYAIIGGISQYAGRGLDLKFAAKDAVDIANAIDLGARRLFGADKVHLTLLTTANDPRAIAPTKDNFTKAFAAARQAKPTDILIIYLAGHGITLQRGSDTYCYLTEEARTTDTSVLSDPEVRKRETITSEELVDWIKQIPALKQTVVLDTCAAGAAQGQFKLVDKREASGDAIRAIDRAKDRTGSHILMGSAADAVSYEASQYGQGLLTYALLKGMKGPALNNDEFVDVSKLFLFAREEVEQLAKNIGGIQKPIIFAPNEETFDVGQLKIEDRQKIALATSKPLILRPLFLDPQAGDDTLDLMKILRALLRDESFVVGRGASEGGLLFVDDDDFPGGIRPTGTYTVNGDSVTVRLYLRRDGIQIFSSQVTGTKSNVALKVMEAVKTAIRKM